MRGMLIAAWTALALMAALAASTPASAKAPEEKDHGDPPAEVRIGGLINDIQQLDLQSHSYNVDMYIWFKWDDPKHRTRRARSSS